METILINFCVVEDNLKAEFLQLIPSYFQNDIQEEYLEALNKQEISKKELDGVKHQRDQLTSEVKTLKKEVDSLQKIYQEQDELLGESV